MDAIPLFEEPDEEFISDGGVGPGQHNAPATVALVGRDQTAVPAKAPVPSPARTPSTSPKPKPISRGVLTCEYCEAEVNEGPDAEEGGTCPNCDSDRALKKVVEKVTARDDRDRADDYDPGPDEPYDTGDWVEAAESPNRG